MNSSQIEALLDELESILRANREANWIKGISAARAAFARPGGVAEARSIYESMCRGSASFSDYYISREDFEAQRKANEGLDRVRADLWAAFKL